MTDIDSLLSFSPHLSLPVSLPQLATQPHAASDVEVIHGARHFHCHRLVLASVPQLFHLLTQHKHKPEPERVADKKREECHGVTLADVVTIASSEDNQAVRGWQCFACGERSRLLIECARRYLHASRPETPAAFLIITGRSLGRPCVGCGVCDHSGWKWQWNFARLSVWP